jgi:hypothetical protein
MNGSWWNKPRIERFPMGDMIRCNKCKTHHYRNDPCPDDEPRQEEEEIGDANILDDMPDRGDLLDGYDGDAL